MAAHDTKSAREQARTATGDDNQYRVLLAALFEQGELSVGSLRACLREQLHLLTTTSAVFEKLNTLHTWGLAASARDDAYSEYDARTWSLTALGARTAQYLGQDQALPVSYICRLHRSTSLQALLMVLGETSLSVDEIEQGLHGLSYFGLHRERLMVRLYALEHLEIVEAGSDSKWRLTSKGLQAIPLLYALDTR